MKNILILFCCIIFWNQLSAQDKYSSKWLLIYYMPYDNNLSYLGEDIITMIQKGVDSEEVIVVVQADYEDTLGMRRYIIQKDTTQEFKVEEEYSGSNDTFTAYLQWVATHFKFQKSAVIFLDHGGRLNEVCLDEWPKREFLQVDQLKKSLKSFNQSQKRKIDLFFFQVCTKGVIEALYELKDVADYTLASQTVLGAPNAYYKDAIQMLGKQPDISGSQLARLIATHEAENMYNSYTCIDNSKLESFKEKFYDFCEIMIKNDSLSLQNIPLKEFYASEVYWDIVSFLNHIELSDSSQINLRNELVQYIEEELIVFHHKNPIRRKIKDLSGLSILSLHKGISQNYESYKYLNFYKGELKILDQLAKIQKPIIKGFDIDE